METNNQSGRFRVKKHNFTTVSNNILKDSSITLKAKGLYAMIEYYLSIPNFTLYKQTLMNSCGEGERAFNSAWKELKESGYLKQYKIQSTKGFYYEYELLDDPDPTHTKCTPGKCTSGKCKDGDPTSGKDDTLINNENNNTLTNNTSSNNSFIHSDKTVPTGNYPKEFNNNSNDFLKEGMTIKETIIANVKNDRYDFDDYVEFAKEQIDVDTSVKFIRYTDDPYRAVEEWAIAMADIYSCTSKEFRVGKRIYDTKDIKLRLLKIDHYIFTGLLMKFADKANSIKNVKSYMQTMLINACFDSGVNQSHSQKIEVE